MRIFPLLVLGLAGPASAATVDRVAAVVDDDVVALSEIYDLGGDFIDERCSQPGSGASCRTEAELEVLDALIQRALIRRELVRLTLDVNSQDIDRAIDTMVRQYGMTDRDQLKQELSLQGISWEDYREQLAEQLRQMKFSENVLRPRISVSDNEVRDLYQRTARDFAAPTQAELEAFALAIPPGSDEAARAAVLEEARAVVAALRAGEREWLATVKELDVGPYAEREGKMGTFAKGELAPDLDAAVWATEAGGFAEPVVLGDAVVVVKVAAKSASAVLPYEQVEGQLREQIYQSKIEEELEQWYQQARRQAAVKVMLGDGT